MPQEFPWLPRVEGGYVKVSTPEQLAQLVSHPGTDLSSETISFDTGNWDALDDQERALQCAFVQIAVSTVVDARCLPAPLGRLPRAGTRVEAMVVGGKPGPPSKYGTGVVTGVEWDSVFRTWRVDVLFDQPAGSYYGHPIRATNTFPDMVHVVGSDERPYSSMTPAEIWELYLVRRREFWLAHDPSWLERYP